MRNVLRLALKMGGFCQRSGARTAPSASLTVGFRTDGAGTPSGSGGSARRWASRRRSGTNLRLSGVLAQEQGDGEVRQDLGRGQGKLALPLLRGQVLAREDIPAAQA